MPLSAADLDFDHNHLIHPYTSMTDPQSVFLVKRAEGCQLHLADGRQLVDGMSSWWAAIHGYNHPILNQAITEQLTSMAHVMFGGLTHEPAIRLGQQLLEICPPGLSKVFYSDSGSVAVEVAIKMAIQYWQALGERSKTRFLSLRRAYHGDTFAAMSVCDPVTGMHTLFADSLQQQYFADAPRCRFSEAWDATDIISLEHIMAAHHPKIAALILEPVVQGAGGMFFYSPTWLAEARVMCDRYGILLIADEIATGFGRTGKMFGCEHAGVSPDIMCVGKALTGGYISLAATLCTDRVAAAISANGGVFMHGPTFMANPLACAAASASVQLLRDSPWQARVAAIAAQFERELSVCRNSEAVADVRVLGAIGVVELKQTIDMSTIQPRFVELGAWVRPFGRLLYLMPPFVISSAELSILTHAVQTVISEMGRKRDREYMR